ncbi:MAG: hypothetical protein AB7K24_31730 [Gemmataceae bacterium]
MICQNCGIEAPTKYVAFYQNIGLLILRMSKGVEGELCKPCIHHFFWEFTMMNLIVGWWGVISLIVTPFFILNNIVRYLFCLGMASSAEGAVRPMLTEEVAERLGPYTEELFRRIGEEEPIDDVVRDIGERADATPGQVCLYLRAVIEAARNQAE